MMRGREDWNQKLVAVAIDKDKGSQHALKWALQRLVTKGQTILLIHVNTNAVPIPSSIGNQASEAKEEANQQQQSAQIRELFLPFRCFCTRKDIQCRDTVIEDTDISKAIVNYVSNYAIEDLVLGASSRNPLVKRFKGSSDVPTMVSKAAPDFCSVYVVSKEKVSSHRPANRPPPPIANHRKQILMRQTAVKPAIKVHEPQSPTILDYQQGRPSVQSDDSESIKSPFSRNSRGSNVRGYREWNLTDSDISFVSSGRPSSERSYLPLYDQLETSRLSRGSNGGYCTGDNVSFDSIHSGQRSIDLNSLGPPDTSSAYSTNSGRLSSTSLPMEDVDAEMRRLRLELKHTMDMYSNACKEAINAKQKARELHRWRLEEEQKLEEARMAEELARNLAEKEKAKCRAAMEKAEAAQRLAEMEAQRRRSAEMKAGREADEKANALSALTRGDVRYRRYCIDEIERATDYFAEARKIGEGSYGPVYRCYLDHTPVAVKVLRPDAAQGRTQFQQEVEILSCIRHPNMVLLLGACPEYGCLVYEYLANGSLEDRLFRRGNTPPLSWQTRFRIAAEIATALLFLHQTKPEPLVHRDLKPANILLDRNYVSKISDVGLARLVPPSVASNVTQYRMTSTAGTFCYIDPEYQQTGMLTIKSDIYSLGIMLLQLVTGRVAMGLTHHVENAIENGKFEEMLDPLVMDWPVEEALCFAKMALRCAELRRKERPDLASEVLPELDRLRGQAEESFGCFSNAGSAVASPAFSLVSNPQETVSDNSGYESRSSMSSAAGRGSSVE